MACSTKAIASLLNSSRALLRVQSFVTGSRTHSLAVPFPRHPMDTPRPASPGQAVISRPADAILDPIRRHISNFEGGKLDLFMDEGSGVATLTIDNPQRKNAFSGRMMAQFSDIITQLEQWQQGKAVIMHGSEGFFCSGGDLTTVRNIDTSEGGRQMGLLMQHNLSRFQSLPLITVAVVQGKAIGGGAELLTACDFRLMTADSELGFVHVKLGITVGWGGGSRLVQLVGPSNALDLMLSGRRITAAEALQMRLINQVFEDCLDKDIDHLLLKTRDWLKPFIEGPTKTLHAIKQIVTAAKLLPLEEALEKELQMFASVWGGPAHKKAMTLNLKHK